MASQVSGKAAGLPRAMIFIIAVVLLDVIGFSMLFPVTAYIVREYNTSASAVTLLTVIYAAAQFLAAPWLGRVSDRFGRRPVLLICVFGSALGYILFGIGGALWVLFLSRLIDGVTGGNFSVATAYVADVTPPEQRARNFGMVGAAFGLGFVLGPAMGGALSQISLAAPAFAAGLLSLITVTFGYFFLPESLPPERRSHDPLKLRDINPMGSISQFGRRPVLGTLLTVFALFHFAFNARNVVLPVFAIDKYGVAPASLALLFTLSGLGNIIVQGFLVGRLVPRFGERSLVSLSLLSQAAIFLLTFVAPAFWMQYPINVVATGLTGLLWPTMGALIANQVQAHEQGGVAGVSTALSSLMSVLGPLWAGFAYDTFGQAAPFVSGAAVLLAAWGLMSRARLSSTVAAIETR